MLTMIIFLIGKRVFDFLLGIN